MNFAVGALLCLVLGAKTVSGAACAVQETSVYEHQALGIKQIRFEGVIANVRIVKSRVVSVPTMRVLNRSTSGVPDLTLSGGVLRVEGACRSSTNSTSSTTSQDTRVASSAHSSQGFFPLFLLAFASEIMRSRRSPVLMFGALLLTGMARSAWATDQCQESMDVEIVMPECSICVMGCAPYGVDKYDQWKDTVKEMARQCDLMIHVGDIMGGGPVTNDITCNKSLMEAPIVEMSGLGKPLLFTPADNEVADCHRGAKFPEHPVDFVKAEDARNWWIQRFFQDTTTDLTGSLPITTQSSQCPFNVYVTKCQVAISTYEVPGSHWYLQDESSSYPTQDAVDPLAGRKAMYDRAKDCTMTWLESSFAKAKQAGLKTLILAFHAAFWEFGSTFPGSYGQGITSYKFGGDVWNMTTLGHLPYQPFADKIIELVDANPNLMVYSVNSDWHFYHSQSPMGKKNYVNVMTEGDSTGATSFVKLSIDPTMDFDQVSAKEVHVTR